MKKVNKKKLMILLLSLLLIIIAAGGCGIGNNKDDNSQETNTDDKTVIEEEENSEVVNNEGEEASEEERLFPRVQVIPKDEGEKDPSFKEFRDEFIAKLKEKDLDYLIAHLDPNIRVSFGDTMGIKGFKEYHGLNEDFEDSKVWYELIEVLRLGGQFSGNDKKYFVAPYVYASFPQDIDAFQYSLITNSRVNIRKEPSSKAKILENISYEVVQHSYLPPEDKVKETINGEEYYWEKIVTSKGNEGYVYGKYVRSSIDYRGFFSKDEKGLWKLDTFVAGD